MVQDILSGEAIKEVQLSGAGAELGAVPVSEPEPVEICLIDPTTGTRADRLSWQTQPIYGLVITAEDAYLYPANPLDQELLALSRSCLYPGIPDSGRTAYDLSLSDDLSLLFISDREAGELIVFSLEEQQIRHRVQVRPQGHKKSLNLAYDEAGHRLLMTDNQSFMLYELELESYQLRKIDIGMSGYALGNLVMSPDGEHLYLLTLKPSVELLYLHIDSRELIKQIPLKGELFSNGQGDPQDLMVLTPDQGQLLLMTYLEEPDPFTPIITVLNTDKVKTTQRYALKGQVKPAMLAFPFANEMQKHQKTVLEMLLEQGLITHQQLESLNTVDLDDPNGPDEGQGLVPTLSPQAAEPLAFEPATALPAILEALSEKFYAVSEVEIKSQPEGWAIFETEAERVRQTLEGFDAAEIKLEGLLGKYALDAVLTRQEVLGLIEKHAREAEAVITHPEKCPNCTMVLSSWDCASCGLELESPERAEMRRKSSLTPIANVPMLHLLLADPKRQRVLRLDQNRTLEWTLAAESLTGANPRVEPWQNPVWAQWLPNKNLLVVDRDAHQIYEFGPSGQLKWMLHQQAGSDTELKSPVKVTYFEDGDQALYLIVDQGHHRVLAVDVHSKVHWQYGQTGKAAAHAGHLREPSDLQWTWNNTCLIADTGNDRVVEVSLVDKSVVRIFGPDQALSGPTFAQRLENGHTLIVDAGNYRVLEIDDDGDTVVECFYFKDEMGDAMRIDKPTFVMRGDKQNVILMDEDKIIELLPAKRRLIWSSLLEHLAHRVEIQEDSQDSHDNYIKSFYQHRMPTMDQIIGRLKKKADTTGALNAKLMESFNRLLEVKRTIDAHRAEKSKVKRFHKPELLKLPIYVVDRTHRHLVRIDRKGNPLWHFGTQPEYRLQRPTHVVETDDGTLLLADTSNQTVLEIDPRSDDVLQVIGGKEAGMLNQPRSAYRTLSGNTLIADQGNRRLIEVNAVGDIVWEFKNITRIASPYFAAEQGTGTILYADWALQMVLEIKRDGTVLWSYGQSRRVGDGPNQLSSPEYAIRLPAGSTLIADTRNNRVIEVAPNRSLIWEYRGSEALPLEAPSFCKRLPDGHTLIAYDNYRQLIEVDANGRPCWQIKLGNQPLVR